MTDDIRIHEASASDLDCWLDMAHKLWPTSPIDELKWELELILDSDRDFAAIVRLNDTPIGFMNLSLRYDHVSGATHRPAAYLEGIYVEPPHRNRGVARRLVDYAEEWARSKGAKQLGSDALLENVESQAFHERVGFREMERSVAYIKDVDGKT